jgi:hypothetical protein
LLRSPSSLRADRAWQPPTSSSLVDEEHVPSLLLSTATRDAEQSKPRVDFSSRGFRVEQSVHAQGERRGAGV